MFLASVRVIREQLGFDDMTDINAAIEMALNSAEAQLAAQLGTQFGRTQLVDTFWVYEPGFRQGNHVETQLRLRRGMVAGEPEIVSASSVSLLAQGNTMTGIQLDAEKGVLTDYTTDYYRRYVRVSYTAGFEAEMEDVENGEPRPTGSYVLSQVPEWLQEAAKLKALIHLSSSETIKDAGITIDVKAIDAQLAAIVNQHLRYTPLALLPI